MAAHLNLKREEFDWLHNARLEKAQEAIEMFPTSQHAMKHGNFTGRNGNPSLILTVDDKDGNFQSIGQVLGWLGFGIDSVKSSDQALAQMKVRHFDLVSIDLLNPDVDAYELCRLICNNQAWAGIPVIIHSLTENKSLASRAFESGAADCMTSSRNQAELILRILAQLSHKNARDSLKQMAADKEEALGNLMHQLKNHLVGMHMAADVLRDDGKWSHEPALGGMIDDISGFSGQMLSFVDLFLSNASTEQELVINLEPVCLSGAASRSIQQFQVAARRKELILHASFPAEGVIVHADPNALNQVLNNLLSNAVKFSPMGKQISVIVRPTSSHVECQVHDQGDGFTAEDKTRMFHRYRRLSTRPTGGESSAGLGLSIVKKLVEAMRGELALDSDAGCGARFSIRLPKVVAESESRS